MIYLCTQYYPPVNNPAARRMECFAKAIIDSVSERDLVVVTGRPNFPDGKVKQYTKWAGTYGEFVVRLWEYATPFTGRWRKTLGLLSYAANLFRYLVTRLRMRNALVVVTTGPVFSLYAVWLAAKIRRFKYVVDVRDLWPQMLDAMGILHRGSVVYRLSSLLSSVAYRDAENLIVNSPGIAAELQPARSTLIYNPLSKSLSEISAPGSWRLVGRPYTFVYSGMFSRYMDVHCLLDSLALLALRSSSWRMIFVGEGDMEQEVRDGIVERGLQDCVEMRPYMSQTDLNAVYMASDCGVVCQVQSPTMGYSMPAKLLEYLAAGMRAVVAHPDGPAGEVIKTMPRVWWVPAGDQQRMAEAMVSAVETPVDPAETAAGRAFAMSAAGPDVVGKRFLEVLWGSCASGVK